jgi:aspartokinase
VNVELISHGGSDINLTFVIDELEIDTAVAVLHSEFFAAGIAKVYEREIPASPI